MKTPLFSLATFSAFALLHVLTPSSVSAEESTNNIQVETKEFRYDKPYVVSQEPLSLSENTFDTSAKSKHNLNNVSGSSDATLRKEKHLNISKSSNDIMLNSVNEFWIYDTWTSLDNDIDYDGYFSTFSVEFDADTIFMQVPVYAVLYIGTNGQYDAIHVSSVFYIYGEDATDSFTIESTLISGFPSNDYDVLIELYDADTEMLVAFSDGYDDASLAYLPLESKNNEYIVEDTVVIIEEHGGSWSILSLLALGFTIIVRTRRKLIAKK